jgi:outer membrane protein OmpA-like peptidoglycan-associated protein
VADIREDGSFSEPRNLGPEINTEGKEMFPFINGSKLYFASDGHVGLGGLDIYEVAYNGTEGFLEVRNLGKPINSNKDDFSFIVKEATQKGFFASNRKGGKGDDDIYSFERLAVEGTNENAIAGVATERLSGNKIPDALIQLLDENNRKLKEMVGQQDGSFVFEDLEGTTRYVLRVAKDGYKPHEELVTTLENQKVEVEPALERLEDRILVEDGIKKLRTDMIYFDFDKSAIRPDAAEELDKLATVMQEYPEMIIKIESHTDTRGRADYNKYLSGLRAKASRDYLILQGIASERIESAKGYGEERLLNECNGKVRCNAVEHERNRRSEFIIVSM